VGGSLDASAHVVGVLVVDAATGTPLAIDYGSATTAMTNADGTVASVVVARKPGAPSSVRVYSMVDATPVTMTTRAL